jgi:tetratricopeptide (TPR) repeat protein
LTAMLPMREMKPARPKSEKEDLQFEIQFFEGIAKRDPSYIEALQVLGDAYTKSGQWEKGLLVDKRLARLCPDNPLVFYNLACSYSLMSEIDQAFSALRRAVRLGYRDARWLNKDPDLENLRHDTRFDDIRNNLAKKRHEG